MIWKKIIKYTLGIAIILVIISWVGIGKIIESISKSNPLLLILAVLLFSISIVTKVLKWYYISRKNKVNMSLKESFVISLPSFFFANITPGRIGEAYKCIVMERKYGLNYSKSLVMLFMDKFTEFSAVVIIAILAILIFPFITNFQVFLFSGFIILLGIIIVFVLNIKWVIKKFEKIFLKLPFIKGKNLTKIHDEIDKNIRYNLKIGYILKVYSFTIIAIFFEGIRSWLILNAFGINTNLFHITIILCFATVLGIISAIPLGLGVTEVSMAAMYTLLGINIDVSTAAILIDRFITSWAMSITGLFFIKSSWKKGISKFAIKSK